MSGHGWSHPVCDECYSELEPGREPHRLRHPEIEVCCRCAAVNASGIYYRADPDRMGFCHIESAKSLAVTVHLMNIHVENLIERVAALEGVQTAAATHCDDSSWTYEDCDECGEWFGDQDNGCDACVDKKWEALSDD